MVDRTGARWLARLVGLALAVWVVAAAPSEARACSCLPTDFPTLFARADGVVQAEILGERTRTRRSSVERVYRARVTRSYKGCFRSGQRIRIVTPIHEGICGVEMIVGNEYVLGGALTGKARRNMHVDLCSVFAPAEHLGEADREYLESRVECCRRGCRCVNGEPPVQCFVDPCDVATCPEGTCTASDCGGCRADFTLEDGSSACTPCSSDWECRLDQRCDEQGRCVSR